jgi:glycosyltransferase 2 family protein
MSRRMWAWARLAGGAAILAVLVWRLGTGPIVDGLRTIDMSAVLAAVGIAVVTTGCSAWRWSLVARGLGVAVPLPAAFAAYYRSQFLNTALPGGILGDGHRAVSHGRDVGDVGRGLRAVAWERAALQVVEGTVALGVLTFFPSPVHRFMPVVVPVAVAVAGGAVLLARVPPGTGSSRWARVRRAAGSDVRAGLLARRTWPGIVASSVVVVAGHTATFMVAARTAGVSTSTARLLPLALIVLLAMTVPTNIGGWGPREGVAAWLFGAAGLGAGAGVASSTVYGVLVIAASLPGAAVLVGAWWVRRRAHHAEPARSEAEATEAEQTEGERSDGPTPVLPGAGRGRGAAGA